MRKLLLTAALVAASSLPAAAQVVGSNAVSGSVSQSGVTFAPSSYNHVQRQAATSTAPSFGTSYRDCVKYVGGNLGVPAFNAGLSIPLENYKCETERGVDMIEKVVRSKNVAAAHYLASRDAEARASFIAAGILTDPAAVAASVPVAYANTKPVKVTKGRATYQDRNSPYYSPNIRD